MLASMEMAYQILNVFFHLFHTILSLFIVAGWMWHKTRLLNLVALLLTAASWFGLGFWYGFGFCPCTEWHWRVRTHLGCADMPRSYIKFLFDRLTGCDAPPAWVDGVTLGLFAFAFVMAIVLNARDFKRARAHRGSSSPS